ncbi:hypothetical protein SBA3_1760025 [Candidatus Sulfopaludibacter sp. SbA3]|nr:hypothetical protein SBA3_1760025 [Candidatus Sulfopaludibacter sp. SbA3]
MPSIIGQRGNWPGPYTRLRANEIGLTRTLLLPNQTMRYAGVIGHCHRSCRQ